MIYPIIYKDVWRIDPEYIGFGWSHVDFDGAPDAYDDRCGNENTVEACKTAIDEYLLDNGEED